MFRRVEEKDDEGKGRRGRKEVRRKKVADKGEKAG